MLIRVAAGLGIQVGAALLFLAAVWIPLRFALGLRYAKVVREEAREAQAGPRRRRDPVGRGSRRFLHRIGRRIRAALDGRVAKADVVGGRLLLRGGAIGEFARAGVSLPAAAPSSDYEGRERWDVVLHLADGSITTIACGILREGVSRDVATRVFEAVRAAL